MKQPQKNKLGATPGKLALVGVLAVVLVLVIMAQMPTDSAPVNLSLNRVAVDSQVAPVNKNEKKIAADKSDSKPQQEAREWPRKNLATALAHDPFALPTWKDRPEALANNNSPGLLATLQEQGASILMIGTTEKSATIGDQRVQVGDILDGYKITDITDEGIVLDKL